MCVLEAPSASFFIGRNNLVNLLSLENQFLSDLVMVKIQLLNHLAFVLEILIDNCILNPPTRRHRLRLL